MLKMDTRYEKMVWKMGCNTLASCVNKFLYEGGHFATPIYHDIEKIWMLTLHKLYDICCT